MGAQTQTPCLLSFPHRPLPVCFFIPPLSLSSSPSHVFFQTAEGSPRAESVAADDQIAQRDDAAA